MPQPTPYPQAAATSNFPPYPTGNNMFGGTNIPYPGGQNNTPYPTGAQNNTPYPPFMPNSGGYNTNYVSPL